VDGTDSLRTVIQRTKDIWQVINGLGLTNDPEGMIPLIEATCHASALSAFQDTMSTTRERLRREREEEVGYLEPEYGETADEFRERQEEEARAAEIEFSLNRTHVEEAVRAVIVNACPFKVLQKQKRYMQRFMRKPADMKIRAFVHNVMKLNHEELPHLPPFGTRQMFSEDDVIEIILNACPQSWVKRVTTTYVE
jgi:hypothetical protein